MELWRRLLFPFRRGRFDRELEEEMQFHLEMKARRNREAGVPPDEAQYAARRKFGNALLMRESSRDPWGWGFLDSLAHDVRYALRMLRKNPGFTAVTVAVLALGIGANTAIFSAVYAVLLRPLPFPQPDRIVQISTTWASQDGVRGPVCELDFQEWLEQSRSFERMAAVRGATLVFTGAGEPEEIHGNAVSPDFFRLLGVRPQFGREFEAREADRGANNVIILSRRLWQRRFGSDPGVIGKPVVLGGGGFSAQTTKVIVGVAPPEVHFPEESTEYWLPLVPDRNPTHRNWFTAGAIGRLKAGVTIEAAQAEMDVFATRLTRLEPRNRAGFGIRITPLHESIVGGVRPALLWLFGAVALLLLIACANVAGLLLARAARRNREITIRLALGSGRFRLVRYLLTESLVLGMSGGLLGLGLAYFAIRVLTALLPFAVPLIQSAGVDGAVLAFTLLISIANGVIVGLMPALRASRTDLSGVLKENSPMSGARRNPVRSVLVAAQIALALVFVSGAGLLLRSFLARLDVRLGFNPDGLLAIQLPWEGHRLLPDLLARVKGLPGVVGVGASSFLPNPGPNYTSDEFSIEGRPKPEKQRMAGVEVVTPDFFRTLRIPLLRGRSFTEADGKPAPLVCVINETMARLYLPTLDPIGRHMLYDNKACSIVGLVGDITGYSPGEEPVPMIYQSYLQAPWPSNVSLMVRNSGDTAALVSAIRQEIRLHSKTVGITRVETMDRLLSESVASPRFFLVLVGAFAALALAIATLGVYGVVNYLVVQRTHEIGLRVALGAAQRQIIRMVLREGGVLIGAGIALGLCGAWMGTRALAAQLYRVRPTDPLTLTGVCLVLAAAGFLACYLPARRAARVNPVEALRYE
jgi:predicted permease